MNRKKRKMLTAATVVLFATAGIAACITLTNAEAERSDYHPKNKTVSSEKEDSGKQSLAEIRADESRNPVPYQPREKEIQQKTASTFKEKSAVYITDWTKTQSVIFI